MKLKSILFSSFLFLTLLSFSQNFNSVRNSTKTITSCTGNVYDHGGSGGDYLANSNDTIIIFADDISKGVEVKIKSIDIYNEPWNLGVDQIFYIGGLEVRDGVGNTTSFLNSGTYGEGDYFLRSKQLDGSITMIFEAPSDGTGAGFHYSISCFDLPKADDISLPSRGNTVVTKCNSSVLDDGGRTNNYSDNVNSSVTLYPEEEGQAIQLDLKSFGVAGSGDVIKIFNGTNTWSSPIIESSQGDTQLDQDIFVANNEHGALTVSFSSDNANNSRGFEFESSCVATPFIFHDSIVPFAKSHTITTCDQFIYDNGGANGDYKNDSDGYLTIFPEDINKVIKLDVVSFVANSVDYISVYDSAYAKGVFRNVDGTSYKNEFISTNTDGALTVRFRSNDSGVNDGFRLKVSCLDETPNLVVPLTNSLQVTSCDTVFYDNGDAFGNYANNSDGFLTILPTDDSKLVSLSPSSLDILGDRIDVYNGLDTNGSVLKTYSTFEDFTFENVFSSDASGALTIRFKSNDEITYSGFSFSASCTDRNTLVVPSEGNNVITSCDTTVYDNGGAANNYFNRSNGSLTIYPSSEDSVVVVTIDELNTENSYDILSVYNDTTEISNQFKRLAILSGNQVPIDNSFQSSNDQGAITLGFKSDNYNDGQGFKVSVSCQQPELVVPFLGSKTVTTCDTIIYDNGGSLGNYKDGSNGNLIVLPESADQKVVLNLEYFESGARDWITIYDGDNFLGIKLLSLESGVLPAQVIKAGDNSNGALYIKFSSNSTLNEKGFKFIASCELKQPKILVPKTGQDTVYTCNDTIYDNGGPDRNYSARSSGSLLLIPNSQDSIMSLEILTYDLADNSGDRLFIQDGIIQDGTILLNTTSDEFPSPSYFESRHTSRGLTVSFSTNSSGNAAGFAMLAKCVSKLPEEFTFPFFNETITTCDTVIYDHGGSRLSYEDRRGSYLTILPENENQNVVINIESFNTIEGDILTVFDGDSRFTSPELLEYSGANIPQSVFEASNSDGVLMIGFDTDFNDVTSDGFKITTSCMAKPIKPIIIQMPSSGKETITTCNAVIYDDGGASGNYGSNVFSQLTILPIDTSYHVKVEIEELDIDYFDYLQIYDNSTTTDRLGIYTDTKEVGDSFVASNTEGAITLDFNSDFSNVSSGFKIKVSCIYDEPHVKVPVSGGISIETCDTLIVDNGGNFGDYSNYSDGFVTILPSSDDSVVVVEIIEFDTEYTHDFLSVYDGDQVNDLVLFHDYELSGGINKFESSLGAITIKFTSNSFWESTGFKIISSCEEKVITSVSTDLTNDSFELYPNPSSGDKVYFDLENKNIKKIRAISVSGQMFDLDFSEKSIEIDHLKVGVYSIQIITSESILTRKLFIE